MSKLEIGEKLYYYNSVLYLMEFEINLIKELLSLLFDKCEVFWGEEELYIDMLLSV